MRLLAWLRAKLTHARATLGGYWGGIAFWDLVKAAAARAANFLRRQP